MASSSAKHLVMVMCDINPEDEDEFNRWYDEEHLQHLANCEGVIAARRYVSVQGEPKYLAIYEVESLDALEQPGFKFKQTSRTEWQEKMTKKMKNFSKITCTLLTERVHQAHEGH